MQMSFYGILTEEKPVGKEARLATLVSRMQRKAVFLKDQVVNKVFMPVNNNILKLNKIVDKSVFL